MHGLFAVALVLSVAAPNQPHLIPPPGFGRFGHAERARVTVWSNREDPYRRGEAARVYFKTETDAYITLLRIDTDGRLRVLFPLEPWEDNLARGGRTFEVLGRADGRTFLVDDYPGVGYLFAVASEAPFDYDEIVRGDHWDYRVIANGRVRGDPYVTLTDLAARITADHEYDYDIVPYYVERHYDYPRFLCYDCHSYASYSAWDPYDYSCVRFRIVIYDDPYYYPYRRYGGTNVAWVRPAHPAPRYVFKDADPGRDYVTRVRQRPLEGERRVQERDRSSRDVGGRGAIPIPIRPRTRDEGPREKKREELAPRRFEPPPPEPDRRRPQLEKRETPSEEKREEREDRGPRRREPIRAEPARPEPQPDAPHVRDKPRVERPSEPRTQEPKSTGEPELKRRRKP